MEEAGTKGISEEERTGGQDEDEDEGTEASGGRKGELEARGQEEVGEELHACIFSFMRPLTSVALWR